MRGPAQGVGVGACALFQPGAGSAPNAAAPAAPPAPTKQEALLAEIRDLLKAQARK